MNLKRRREEQKNRREFTMKLLRIKKKTKRDREHMREKMSRERMSC